MTFEFDEAIAVAADGTANIPHRWTMGPGFAHGGYLMSLALTGATKVSTRPHAVTMSAHFARPAMVGPATVRSDLVKAGRALATVGADVVQDGKTTVTTITTFGDLSNASEVSFQTAVMPDIADRASCHRADPDAVPLVPRMAENLELLLTPDSVTWAQGKPSEHATMRGWVRFSDGRPIDAISLPMFADAFPPPVFGVGARIAWMPTVEFTLHTRRVPETEWLAVAFHTDLIGGSFFESSGTLWDEQGRLVAMSRQIQLIRSL